MVSNATLKVLQLEENINGRDFVVGDIHGYYDDLLIMLKRISFDKTKDRLISCGDLIDRGPDSWSCAQLLLEPWFYCVQGNHEQLMYETLVHGHHHAWDTWVGNGGHWHSVYATTNEYELNMLAKEMSNLPLMIVVGKDTPDRFNVVHAELSRTHYASKQTIEDSDIDEWNFGVNEEYAMTWSRGHINNFNRMGVHPEYQTDKLSLTFCGHNVVRNKPVVVGRQMYIDQGCGFGRHRVNLTIAEPKEKRVFVYSLEDESFMTLEFDRIQNYTQQFGE